MEQQQMTDHDILITIVEQIKGIKSDIKELKDGTSSILDDHENRIRSVESKLGTWAGGLLALQFIVGIALWYFGK